jgi:hypothetical protein
MSRKLDAWIAENVMAIDVQKDKITRGILEPKLETDPVDYFIGDSNNRIPHYTADIKDAWDVAEKIQPTFKVRRLDDGCWCVSTLFDGSYFAESAPMAICLAAYGSKTGEDWEDLKDENNSRA